MRVIGEKLSRVNPDVSRVRVGFLWVLQLKQTKKNQTSVWTGLTKLSLGMKTCVCDPALRPICEYINI